MNAVPNACIDGEPDQEFTGAATEANLDIQYTVSLSYPLKNHFYSTGGLGPLVPDLDQPAINANQNEPYLEFFDALAKTDVLPHTLSFSYGENEQSVPASYAKTICDKIAQYGTRGVSILFSSGDTGPGSACQTNDGKNVTRFNPVFPAACPYVTSVGGTNGINPEKAVAFSSGGFSDLWPRPKYQEAAVKGFLAQQGDKFAAYYNKDGRGFPDIAAQASNFAIIEKQRTAGVSGTSAAAPVIAAIVGLLNARRLEAGQPALGFLNPWIYESGADFLTDITAGKSKGCSGTDQFSGLKSPRVTGAGWNAVKGWDPVTGMGTPIFPKMVEKLPTVKAAPAAPAA
jgi:tripeptidyl-peptidase I